MGATKVVDRLIDAVPYLRVTVRSAPEAAKRWSRESLVRDSRTLGGLAESTTSGHGTDHDQITVSLFNQDYAFRIASIAIGAWLLDDVIVDVAPTRTSIASGRSRPGAVHLDKVCVVAPEDSLATIHAQSIQSHFCLLVANAHRVCRVGDTLLWANVGAACAPSFAAFTDPLPELGALGWLVVVGDGWVWERRACYLWYQTSGASRYDDCSLRTPEECRSCYEGARLAHDEQSTNSEVSS